MSCISSIEHKYPSCEELLEVPKESYVCHICQLKVRTKSNLRAHFIKKHKIVEDENDYAFLTKQKSSRKIIYHCPVDGCKYNCVDNGFTRYFGLKQHYLWVHGEKPYLCDLCKRTFPTASIFRNHSAQCGQLFYCNECYKSFRSKNSLLSHKRCHADHSSAFIQQDLPPPPAAHRSTGRLLATNRYKCDLSPKRDNKSVVNLTNYSSKMESPQTEKGATVCIPFLLPSNNINHCSPLQQNDPSIIDSGVKGVASLVVGLCHYLASCTNNHDLLQQALKLQSTVNALFDATPPRANHMSESTDQYSLINTHSAMNLTTHQSLDASINVVPHVIGAGIQSCAPTIESSIQTDDWRSFINANAYPCEMPSVGVSTDLSLGLDESAVIHSILNSGDSYRVPSNDQIHSSSTVTSVSSTVNESYYSTACGTSTPPYLSSTAMQTDKSEIFCPSTHVETQTWEDLCQEIGLQDLTDIETQTVDIDYLLADM